jgi:hypothetical protein
MKPPQFCRHRPRPHHRPRRTIYGKAQTPPHLPRPARRPPRSRRNPRPPGSPVSSSKKPPRTPEVGPLLFINEFINSPRSPRRVLLLGQKRRRYRQANPAAATHGLEISEPLRRPHRPRTQPAAQAFCSDRFPACSSSAPPTPPSSSAPLAVVLEIEREVKIAAAAPPLPPANHPCSPSSPAHCHPESVPSPSGI